MAQLGHMLEGADIRLQQFGHQLSVDHVYVIRCQFLNPFPGESILFVFVCLLLFPLLSLGV